MKEACDNLRRSNLRREMRDLKSSIFDLAAVRSATSRSADSTSRRRSEFLPPKTVCRQSGESLNLRPILKHNSRRKSTLFAESEMSGGELGPESDSPTTTPSSGSVSFSSRRNPTSTSKYNSLGGHGRQVLPQKRF